MKSDLSPIAESSDSKNPTETSSPRTRRGKRRAPQGTVSRGCVRFFLSKADSNGIPTMDREFDSESEAIVESLKTGRSYFAISEWKGLADLSKKIPLIRKEVVSQQNQNRE